MKTKLNLTVVLLLITLLIASCVRPQTTMREMYVPVNPTAVLQSTSTQQDPPLPTSEPTADPTITPTVTVSSTPLPTSTNFPLPTPDAPRVVPTLRTSTENYTVRAGDSLAVIARQYGVDVNSVAKANGIANPNLLSVGQALVIPPPSPRYNAPDFKIIPDAELVYGPKTMGFDVASFIREKHGYLDTYREKVDDEMVSGATIVERVSQEHSVNPRILLAILE